MSIIVGIVIGAGIYETVPRVLSSVSSPSMALVAWLLGGALSFIGACCYGELASAYPDSGGDYVYLIRAYGGLVGFLFCWAQLLVLMTGSIGMLAYVFSDYAVAGLNLSPSLSALLASVVVIALTVLNVGSLSLGRLTQNVLSLLKVLGITIVMVAGFFLAGSRNTTPPIPHAEGGSFALAMILVLYTFGGWNDAAFVASEVRNPHKNLPRALLLGTTGITLIYILMNSAFVMGLGFERARASRAIAADVLREAFGPVAAGLMAGLVMVSALSAINALIFTGSRVHARLGRDFRSLSALAVWHRRFGSPIRALLAQMVMTLLLIGAVGTDTGRRGLDAALARLGFARVSWSGHGGFDTLLRCTAPVFWAFFALTALSTIVLRIREPNRVRPFSLPLFPAAPLLFTATCIYMLYSAVVYAGGLTFVGLVPVAVGIPIYFLARARDRVPSWHGAPNRPQSDQKESQNEQNHDQDLRRPVDTARVRL